MAAPDFVAIGHVTLDRIGGAVRPGGAALYAAVTADRLGLSAAILTSHGDDFPLAAIPSRIEVVSVPAPETTVFEHRQEPTGRRSRVFAAARPLGSADVPEDWLDAEIVFLAPVLDEVDPDVAWRFSGGAVGAGAQGWLRDWAPGREVTPRPWDPSPAFLGRLQGLFVSTEDVRGQESSVMSWLERLPVGVVTAGRHGAVLYVNGDRYEVRPRPAKEVDATGAGDVFAAAFLIRYRVDGDPWQAAAAATVAASMSVEAEGWTTVPDLAALEAALARYGNLG